MTTLHQRSRIDEIEELNILEQTSKEIEELAAQARDGCCDALSATVWSNWWSFKKYLGAGHLDADVLAYLLLEIFEEVAEAMLKRGPTELEEQLCFHLVQAVRVHEAQRDRRSCETAAEAAY